MNVTGFDSDSREPTLKKDLKERLVIGSLTEGIYYRIVKIDNPEFVNTRLPPKVGEQIAIHYDFKPRKFCEAGYEHLSLFIGRLNTTGRNYVRYFKTIEDMEKVLKNVTFELATEFAMRQIGRLQKEIEKFVKDYDLTNLSLKD